ncbi:MAG: JAB domain-containing protein [Sphingomicrobium sp.]
MHFQHATSAVRLNQLEAAKSFFAGCLLDRDPALETLFVAHVDRESRCVHVSQHAGDERGGEFPFREIISDAAFHGSAGIVLAHNHPSGDPTPSDSDCMATRRLASAVEAINCTVLDHLIFAGTECTSLRRIGLL